MSWSSTSEGVRGRTGHQKLAGSPDPQVSLSRPLFHQTHLVSDPLLPPTTGQTVMSDSEPVSEESLSFEDDDTDFSTPDDSDDDEDYQPGAKKKKAKEAKEPAKKKAVLPKKKVRSGSPIL
jgi:hypothetical protein